MDPRIYYIAFIVLGLLFLYLLINLTIQQFKLFKLMATYNEIQGSLDSLQSAITAVAGRVTALETAAAGSNYCCRRRQYQDGY